MKSLKLRLMAQVLPFLLIAPGVVLAQSAPTRSEAAAAMKAVPQKTATQPGAAQYSRQQIDQMIAPIALYPDQLLVQVLMAATYPEQLVEAAKWLNDANHVELKDADLMTALEPLPWDPSVKGLLAFPQVVVLMTEHIEWTEALGVAFATQQAQVMNRVQALRQLAVKSGRIDRVKQVSVRREGASIVIVSAEPNRMFVPVYNPAVVYGAWPERAYLPVYLPPPRRFAEGRGFVVETVEPGFEVIGAPVVAPLWGWARPDWGGERISINTVDYTRITRTVQPLPGNYWRREGPVVLVAPAAAPRPAAPAAVAAPAGTVAPAAAAAVVVLPQRAQDQPNAIKVPTTAAQPAATPAPTATASAPATAPVTATAPAPPAPAQPSTPPGSTPSTTAAQPSTPASAPAKTAQPSPSQPSPPPAAAAKPSSAEADKAPKPAAQTATGKPAETPAMPPSAAAKSGEPAGSQADKAKPASGQKETVQKEPGPKEPAPAPAAKAQPPATPPAPAPAAKAQPPAMPPAAEHAGEHGPAGAGGKAPEPVAKAAPAHAGQKPAAVPPPPAQERAAVPAPRPPEQAAVKPPTPPAQTGASAPPAHAGPRPAEPAQGSSAPPAKSGPLAQRPHEAGKAAAPGQPDAGDKKDH